MQYHFTNTYYFGKSKKELYYLLLVGMYGKVHSYITGGNVKTYSLIGEGKMAAS